MAETLLITDPKVKLLGPTYTSPNAGIRTGWQSSAVEVVFTGTSLSVTLAQKVIDASVAYLSAIYVYVDGGDAIVSAFTVNISDPVSDPINGTVVNHYTAAAVPTTYNIASGLSNSMHRARIVFMEGNSYSLLYGGCYSDITHVSTDGNFWTWWLNGTYVDISGDSQTSIVNAWPHLISGITPIIAAHGGMALSGTGVGGGPHTIAPAPVAYPYKLYPNYPSAAGAVPRTDTQCSLAIFFFGINDRALGYSAAAFKAAAQAHIIGIRTRNGDVDLPVFGIRSMYQSDDYNYGAQLDSIASTDLNFHHINTSPQWPNFTYIDGTHLNTAGMHLLANTVKTAINPYLINPNPDLDVQLLGDIPSFDLDVNLRKDILWSNRGSQNYGWLRRN